MAKITFVYPSYENLGIEYLSSYVKKNGHSSDLVFDPFFSNLFEAFEFPAPGRRLGKWMDNKLDAVNSILNTEPDCVGFSLTSDLYGWACDIAKAVKKKKNIPIIFGGMHPTSAPEIIQEDFIDFVCIGEGEAPLKELLDYFDKKRDNLCIDNIWFKNNGEIFRNKVSLPVSNLDCLPMPDKELYYKRYPGFSNRYTIITSRGCPFVCTYCCNNLIKRIYDGANSPLLRRRSAANVINELSLAKEKYRIKSVSFFDEIFTLDIDWLAEFMDEYNKKIKLPFWCNGWPSFLDDKIIGLLLPYCRTLYVGFGTFSERLRAKILRRHYTNDEFSKAIRAVSKTKIFMMVDMILALPGQDEGEIIEIAKFFKRNKVDNLTISILRYYPKTEIVSIAKDMAVLNDGQISALSGMNFFERVKNNPLNNKLFRKGAVLIYLSQILHRKLFYYIIKHKLYRILPDLKIGTSDNLNILFSTLRARLKGKKRISQRFGATTEIMVYFFYFFKKAIKKVGDRGITAACLRVKQEKSG